MKNKRKALVLILIFPSLLFFASLYLPFSKQKLKTTPLVSLHLVDRNNILLRELLSDEGGRCHWVTLEEVSPDLIRATVAAEDKHFFLHPGINFLSIIRAAIQNIKSGRIVSGASTITQQVVRNIYHGRRNIFSKVLEAWLSLRLERTLSKEEILVQYLNRISYGNQSYGIDAASRLYFDKSARDLSSAEAAFLAGIPRSPSTFNPYRNLQRIQSKKREILENMYRLKFIDRDKLQRALKERIKICSKIRKFKTPHFCEFVLQQIPAEKRRKLSIIQTSLDYSLQEKIEILVKDHINSLKRKSISNAAVIVLENTTGEILSMIGSKDFFDELIDGQVNGALALRQPGSTLKPFTYALALEKGWTAATILEDIETHFMTPEGIYKPRNYDKKYHGSIRLRSALACSYNVPAVSVLKAIGPDKLYQRLISLKFESLKESPSFYGIGLTLGNGEVTLLELVQAYATLARGGVFLPAKSLHKLFDEDQTWREPKRKGAGVQIFHPQVAYIITHILKDKDARIPSFEYNSPLDLPFPCAAKTGTSKDFRDNWTIGYTPKFTVGVWAGNFNGKAMHNVSGITGCGILFRDTMLLLKKMESGERFPIPLNIIPVSICPLSGKIARESCPGKMEEIFIKGTEPKNHCSSNHSDTEMRQLKAKPLYTGKNPQREKLMISFPVDGDVFKIDPVLRRKYQKINLKAFVPEKLNIGAVEWWLNNEKVGISPFPFCFSWNLKPGQYIIKVRARKGRKKMESRPVKITVLS